MEKSLIFNSYSLIIILRHFELLQRHIGFPRCHLGSFRRYLGFSHAPSWLEYFTLLLILQADVFVHLMTFWTRFQVFLSLYASKAMTVGGKLLLQNVLEARYLARLLTDIFLEDLSKIYRY